MSEDLQDIDFFAPNNPEDDSKTDRPFSDTTSAAEPLPKTQPAETPSLINLDALYGAKPMASTATSMPPCPDMFGGLGNSSAVSNGFSAMQPGKSPNPFDMVVRQERQHQSYAQTNRSITNAQFMNHAGAPHQTTRNARSSSNPFENFIDESSPRVPSNGGKKSGNRDKDGDPFGDLISF